MKAQEIIEAERGRESQQYWRVMNQAAVAAVTGTAQASGGNVLEIGCGTGRLTKWIASHCRQVVAIDLQPRFSLVEREISGNEATFLLANGLNLCFANGTFDAVIAMEVIEHVEDEHQFIGEALRVLKSQGGLFLTTPNRHRLTSRVRALLGRPITFPHCYGIDPVAGKVMHVKEYSRKELLKLLDAFPVRSAEVEGIYLGIPAWRIGIPHPPAWAYEWSFSWAIKAIKL